MRWTLIPSLLIVGSVLSLTFGCSEPEPVFDPPGADAVSAKDYVNKVQMGKLTTGVARYLPDSVQDMGSGKFQFKDTAGATFEVKVSKDENDEFTMSEPVPVK
jgi:hypothetical protein